MVGRFGTCNAVPGVRIGGSLDVNARMLDDGHMLVILVHPGLGVVSMAKGESDGVGRVVNVAGGVVIVQNVGKADDTAHVLQPVLAAVQGFPLLLRVLQIPAAVSGLPDGGAILDQRLTLCGNLLSVVGAGNTDILDFNGVTGRIPYIHAVLVIQLVFFFLHRQVAGVANIGVFHHHILVLPVHNEQAGLQGDLGLVGVGTQHAHANVIVVPVVAHKTVQEFSAAAVLRDKDLVIELLLDGSDIIFRIALTVPGQDQLQVGLPAAHFNGTRFPVVRIGVHGEGLVILPFLVKIELSRIVIKKHGIAPVAQIIAVLVTLLGNHRCAHPGDGPVQGHLPHAVHQVNLHFPGTRRPVFVNGIILGVFPAGIHLNAVIHLDAHGNLAGIAGKPHESLGDHLLAAPCERKQGAAAHHKVVLAVVGMAHFYKLRRHHLPADIVQRGILQAVQQLLGAVRYGKDRRRGSLRLGRENPGVHLVGGDLDTENIVFPLAGGFAHMVGGRLRGGLSRIEEEIHPGNVILMIAVLSGFHAAYARLGGVCGFHAADAKLNHRSVPRLLLPFLLTGRKQQHKHAEQTV